MINWMKKEKIRRKICIRSTLNETTTFVSNFCYVFLILLRDFLSIDLCHLLKREKRIKFLQPSLLSIFHIFSYSLPSLAPSSCPIIIRVVKLRNFSTFSSLSVIRNPLEGIKDSSAGKGKNFAFFEGPSNLLTPIVTCFI